MSEVENPLVYITAVLTLGILAQWISWKLKLPSILLLLLFGFCLGEFFVRPTEVIPERLLFPAIALSVAIILFEGGLSLRFDELREAGNAVLRLCTLGVLVSWLLTAAAATLFVGLDFAVALLLGAILVVTGPTVVAPLLRTIRPSRKMSSIVKWEGIVIDPIGATLAVLVFSVIAATSAEQATLQVVLGVLKTVSIGIGIGWLAAKGAVFLFARHAVPDYLHSVFLLVATAIVYTISDLLQHESGLLTVTIFGLALANQHRVSVKHIIEFKENLRTLLISTLFIVLSGRVSVAQFTTIGAGGILFLLAMLFVIRPLAVYLSTAGTRLDGREKLFLGLLAPRGIVAASVTSVFALELASEAAEGKIAQHFADQAQLLVPLTFSVIVATVAFCGLFSAPLARKLGVAAGSSQGILFGGASAWVREVASVLQKEGLSVSLIDSNQENVTRARLAGLDAHRGSIVGEFVERLDLAGIGKFMAVTQNDEINAIASAEFTHLFGRANIFQLEPEMLEDSISRDRFAAHLSGRPAFFGAPTFAQIDSRHVSGFAAKVTEITEQFEFEDFLNVHGDDALILFALSEAQVLRVVCDDASLPIAGERVIALVAKSRD